MTPTLLAAVVSALAVFLGTLALTARSGARERTLARLHRVGAAGPPPGPAARATAERSLLRGDAVADNPLLSALLRRLRWSTRRAVTLERAGIPLKVSEYALLLLGLFLVVGFLAALLSGLAPAGIAAGLGTVLVADRVVVGRAKGRLVRFNQQLPAALQAMAASLRSGFSISESIRTVSREMDPPLSTEFARILDEQRMGAAFDDSLDRLVDRIGSVDLAIVTRALQSHRKVGGDLGEILARVAETMRQREALRGHVRAITAEQRFGGLIVGLLPIWVLGFFMVVDPGFVAPLWEEPIGRMILGAGAVMETAAFFLMGRIVSIEV